jgi:large-conductance mechanosensitive channel
MSLSSVSATGFKSFVNKQNLASLSVGLFVLKSVWDFVGSVYSSFFKPVASCVSNKITGKLNLQNISIGCPGTQFDVVANQFIHLLCAMALAYVIVKVLKVSSTKIPVFFALS